MPRKAFITGFGPFKGVKENPSAVLAEAVGGPYRVLDVAWEAVDEWIASGEAEPYEVILHLGYAKRRSLTPELVAHNRNGAKQDVRGVARRGVINESKGPILLSSLWSRNLLEATVDTTKVRASGEAGGYLCNYILYRSLDAYPGKRVGFLHVPMFKVVSLKRQVEVVRKVLELATI